MAFSVESEKRYSQFFKQLDESTDWIQGEAADSWQHRGPLGRGKHCSPRVRDRLARLAQGGIPEYLQLPNCHTKSVHKGAAQSVQKHGRIPLCS